MRIYSLSALRRRASAVALVLIGLLIYYLHLPSTSTPGMYDLSAAGDKTKLWNKFLSLVRTGAKYLRLLPRSEQPPENHRENSISCGLQKCRRRLYAIPCTRPILWLRTTNPPGEFNWVSCADWVVVIFYFVFFRPNLHQFIYSGSYVRTRRFTCSA